MENVNKRRWDFLLWYRFLNLMFLLHFPRYCPHWIFIRLLKGAKRQKRRKWREMISQKMFVLPTTKTPPTLIQDKLRVRLIFLNSSCQWVLKWINFNLRSRRRLFLFFSTNLLTTRGGSRRQINEIITSVINRRIVTIENTLVKVLLNWPEEFRKLGEHKAIVVTAQLQATTLDSFLRSK